MLSQFENVLKSIALVPSVLALCFLCFAILLIGVDVTLPDHKFFQNLVITNKSDVQFILSFIIGGIFTLTIFSYTMVMNVLNRNINNYSPRLIPMLLSEKHHQIILGFSSGTILYAMVLSIAIAGGGEASFPELGASIGIFFSIICVLLFIYFIHSVSQSIHINYILHSVFVRTEASIRDQDKTHKNAQDSNTDVSGFTSYLSKEPGYLRQPNFDKLLKYCANRNLKIHIEKIPGQFVYIGDTLFRYESKVSELETDNISNFFAIDKDVPLDVPEVGFKHLVEVAVKAMSRAINDPGTSRTAVNYLTQLFVLRGKYTYYSTQNLQLSPEVTRTILTQKLLIDACFLEMAHYMNKDPLMKRLLTQAEARIQNFSTDGNSIENIS